MLYYTDTYFDFIPECGSLELGAQFKRALQMQTNVLWVRKKSTKSKDSSVLRVN